MKEYVVDASVVARFVLAEDLSDKAQELLRDFLGGMARLFAPPLVVYEVGNALWRACQRGYISPDVAKEGLRDFLRLGITFVELSEEELCDALDWSIEAKTTYYDTVYVKTAEKLGKTLLTADEKLYRRARNIVPMVHLREY